MILPKSVLKDIGLPVYKTNFILISDNEDWLKYSYGIINYYHKQSKVCFERFLPNGFPLIVLSTVEVEADKVFIDHHILDDNTILECIVPTRYKYTEDSLFD